MQNKFKDTIRLPKTSFPMKANLKNLTEETLKKWEESNVYQAIRKQNINKPNFTLHDGPPYANGHIHLGTALNKILKDIIVKGRNLLGFNAPLVFGWDCHGLPIEWKVEENFKKQSKTKDHIDKVEFRNECRKFAEQWIHIQKNEFKQLGVIGDFTNPYITMDYKTEALIYKEFITLVKNNYIYLGKKPVMWSVVEQTALAEAEVEYINKLSPIAFVGFPVIKAHNSSWEGALAIIWTTTPWTIPGNQALAYHQDITYGLYKIETTTNECLVKSNSKVIIACDLAESLMQQFGVTKFSLLDTNKGLEGLEAKHPLYKLGFTNVAKALAADFVDTTVGTGIVHVAPAYGLDDFYVAQQHHIEAKDIIDDKGFYHPNVPVFTGDHIFKVAPKVLENLQICNTLILANEITHSYPCSWRSKAPLIYRLTSQWFLNLQHNSLKTKILDIVKNDIKFLPKIGKNRLTSMLEQRPDWCLSRQRIWGVPLAMFKHVETDEILICEETYNNIYQAFAQEGSDAWFKGDPKRFLKPGLNPDSYVPVFDVVDVWFDSGSSHVYVLKEREELNDVADIYIEGSDQHRGWFQSSLIESVANYNQAPYKNVITHGFVLDQKGQKMSKSLGNVINPLEVINKYGLDILRLWVANSNYQEDVRAGDSIFKQQVDAYRKIRNTLRYMLGNLTYFNPSQRVNYTELPDLEKLILHGLNDLYQSFKKCFLEHYEFHNFFNELYNFIAIDLSSFYFDIKKDILYCDKPNSHAFNSCLTVMDIIYDYIVKFLVPFIPVTAEEVYGHRSNTKDSVLLTELTPPSDEWHQPELASKYQYVQKIRKEVFVSIENARNNKIIGSGLEAEPIVYVLSEQISWLQQIDLASICITSGIVLKSLSDAPKDAQALGIYVEFNKKSGDKCERCWKISHLTNGLCSRCKGVVNDKDSAVV